MADKRLINNLNSLTKQKKRKSLAAAPALNKINGGRGYVEGEQPTEGGGGSPSYLAVTVDSTDGLFSFEIMADASLLS